MLLWAKVSKTRKTYLRSIINFIDVILAYYLLRVPLVLEALTWRRTMLTFILSIHLFSLYRGSANLRWRPQQHAPPKYRNVLDHLNYDTGGTTRTVHSTRSEMWSKRQAFMVEPSSTPSKKNKLHTVLKLPNVKKKYPSLKRVRVEDV